MDGIDVGYLVKFLLSLLLKVIVSEFAAQSAMQKLALGLTGLTVEKETHFVARERTDR